MVVKTTPHSVGVDIKALKDNESFWIQKASWEYSTPATQIGSYGWPKKPLRLTINSVVTDQISSPLTFAAPRPCYGEIKATAKNDSDVSVLLHLSLDGISVTTKPNSGITEKEILGYLLLDDSQKGMLALTESVVDRWDEEFKKMGGSLRERLPGGQAGFFLESLSKDPQQFQKFLALQETELKLSQNSEEVVMADFDENKETAISSFIGDLVLACRKSGVKVDLDQVEAISTFMVTKGWSSGPQIQTSK